MLVPLGYRLSNHPNIVCKLKKAMYRLKYFRGAWFGWFTRAMKDCGYKQNNRDHMMFLKHMNKGGMVVLIFYVDDILIIGNDEEEIKNLNEGLAQQFDVKSLGTLKYFWELRWHILKRAFLFININIYIYIELADGKKYA